MNYSKISILCLFSLLMVFGCKSKRSGENAVKLKKRSSKFIFDKLNKYHLDAEWFDARASIKITQNNRKDKATAYIRMREDSVIWVSVKKLGFEGGRLFVTPDSVFMINRLDKTYISEPFDYIRNMTGLSSTGDNLSDFRNLQDLILGNVILRMDGKYDVHIKDATYELDKSDESTSSMYHVNGKNFTLNKMEIAQLDSNRKASCVYSDYKSLASKQIFSYIRNLNLYSTESGKIELELDFSKVKLNEPVSTRFSIPKKYERSK